MQEQISQLEKHIDDKCRELHQLRIKSDEKSPVPNYIFETEHGKTTLIDLFGDKESLFAIHNMGSRCIYCTMWADACNGLLPHLESVVSVVLLSPDSPTVQREFADSRSWKFQRASFEDSPYISEQNVCDEPETYPGAVAYRRVEDRIYRVNSCVFGLGDLYATPYSILAMCGIGPNDWTPQFQYD